MNLNNKNIQRKTPIKILAYIYFIGGGASVAVAIICVSLYERINGSLTDGALFIGLAGLTYIFFHSVVASVIYFFILTFGVTYYLKESRFSGWLVGGIIPLLLVILAGGWFFLGSILTILLGYLIGKYKVRDKYV